jgi:hypothetical protein
METIVLSILTDGVPALRDTLLASVERRRDELLNRKSGQPQLVTMITAAQFAGFSQQLFDALSHEDWAWTVLAVEISGVEWSHIRRELTRCLSAMLDLNALNDTSCSAFIESLVTNGQLRIPDLLTHRSTAIREAALMSMTQLACGPETLSTILDDPDAGVRRAVVECIGRKRYVVLYPYVIAQLSSNDVKLRDSAAEVCVSNKIKSCGAAIVAALELKATLSTIWAVGELNIRSGEDALRSILAHGPQALARAARKALRKLG